MRPGIAPEYFGEGLSAPVREAVMEAVARLDREGASTVGVRMPHLKYGLPAYYIISPSEASSNLVRYGGVRHGLRRLGDDVVAMFSRTRRDGFGDEVKRRIMPSCWALMP